MVNRMQTTAEKVEAMRGEWVCNAGNQFDHLLRFGCESPIEELFLAAMLTGKTSGSWGLCDQDQSSALYALRTELASPKAMYANSVCLYDECYGARCVPQCNAFVAGALYRIDFAFFSDLRRYAVELDGHDFHERTKHQAARDKSRDRALTANGWTCLRFAGSEVYADPVACAEQIQRLIVKDSEEWFAGVSSAKKGRP